MTNEEFLSKTESVKDGLIKHQAQIIREQKVEIKKLEDENQMLAAILKYLIRYQLNETEANISFADIERMILMKSNVKVFENIGGEYFLKISLNEKE